MKTDEQITSDNLTLLIQTAERYFREHSESIAKINADKAKRNKKHLGIIAKLDKRISQYVVAQRQEQQRIEKFKKLSEQHGVELIEDKNSSPVVVTENISVVNENTGESVQLSEEEYAALKSML